MDVANVTCALIEEIAGGEVAPGYVDVFPAPKTIDSIKLRLARVHAICGADIEPDFIERSLTRLGCTVERDGEDFMVTPPSFRPDLPREIDLIEEVLRLWGMGRVTATIPAAKNHIGGLTREQKLTRKVGEILRACGLNETTTFGFAAPGDLEKIGMPTEGRGCPVVLMNPLVAEQTEMRRSLLPGLLQSVAYNEAHGTPNVHLYEVGSLFHGRENASLPKETKSVAGVLSGQWSEQSWNMKYRNCVSSLARVSSRSCSPSCASRRFASVPSRARAMPFCSRVVRPRFCPAAPCWVGSARSTPRRASLRHRRGCRCL